MFPELLPIVTAVAALAAVLALIRGGQILLRRSGFAPMPGTAQRLAVLESLALDQRRRLLLIGCEGRQVLLLTGGGQDLVLGWVDPPTLPGARP